MAFFPIRLSEVVYLSPEIWYSLRSAVRLLPMILVFPVSAL